MRAQEVQPHKKFAIFVRGKNFSRSVFLDYQSLLKKVSLVIRNQMIISTIFRLDAGYVNQKLKEGLVKKWI